MTNSPSKISFFRSGPASIVVAASVLLGGLTMHTIAARAYYNMNSKNLQLVASTAVRAGIQYLPVDRLAAIRSAYRFVKVFGVRSDEITSIDVSDDNNTLTISLSREVPEYLSLLAFGLPGRTIRVTASGEQQKIDKPSARSAFHTAALP
jgi:hypothetical protein